MTTHKFRLGQIVATPAALAAFERANTSAPNTAMSVLHFVQRHASGDWGDLDHHDKQANEAALTNGARLLSAYHLSDQTKIWIVTEADRSATTILLPEDY